MSNRVANEICFIEMDNGEEQVHPEVSGSRARTTSTSKINFKNQVQEQAHHEVSGSNSKFKIQKNLSDLGALREK